MRCSASQTTCTVSEPAPREPSAQAGAAFSEMLVRLALRPLAQPLGFYGEVVIDACARTVARSWEARR